MTASLDAAHLATSGCAQSTRPSAVPGTVRIASSAVFGCEADCRRQEGRVQTGLRSVLVSVLCWLSHRLIRLVFGTLEAGLAHFVLGLTGVVPILSPRCSSIAASGDLRGWATRNAVGPCFLGPARRSQGGSEYPSFGTRAIRHTKRQSWSRPTAEDDEAKAVRRLENRQVGARSGLGGKPKDGLSPVASDCSCHQPCLSSLI